MSCFILKKGITGAMYTINKDGRKTVIAFQDGKQAGTYRKLMNEMCNLHHSNKINVERIELKSIVKLCTEASLDVLHIDSQHNQTCYPISTLSIDDCRFVLENKYRYDF